MENIRLQLVSYTDSLFTNAHTLVDSSAAHDGRGTFSHLGVKMDGLESARHLDFAASTLDGGKMVFTRDALVQNKVVLKVVDGAARIEKVEFDTSFYTRNNVHTVYSMSFISDEEEAVVLTDIKLQGDSKQQVLIDKHFQSINVKTIVLHMSEGGLARFRAFGQHGASKLKGQYVDILHASGQEVSIFGVSDASYGDPSLCFRKEREGSVMAGWESCRHSYRHRFCFKLKKNCSDVKRIDIDTYMHSLNAFKYVSLLAYTGNATNEVTILQSLPEWEISYERKGEKCYETIRDKDINDHLGKLAFENVSSVSYSQRVSSEDNWRVVLPFMKLERDTLHQFSETSGLNNLEQSANIFVVVGVPDGGIHRIGIYGAFEE